MKLGFLGTGTIADAVIRGICTSDLGIDTITVSPRNAQTAHKLAADFSCVTVARDNQEVVERSDLVFVALRAGIAEEILKSLTFREGQKVVTFIPTATCAMLSGWIGNEVPVLRAVPLPFVTGHKGATPVFPADPDLQTIFAKIGGVIETENERRLNLFMTAGSLMGVYFRFAGICNDWLQEQGLEPEQAALYLAGLFSSLANEAARQKPIDFKVLQQEYSTRGGTNEMTARLFEEKGGGKALAGALDEAFARISRG